MRVYVYVYTRRQDVRMCVALHTARDHDIVQLRYGTLIQPFSPPPPNPLLQNLLHLSARTHDPPPLLNSSSTPGKPQLRIRHSPVSVSGLRVNSRRVIRWERMGGCSWRMVNEEEQRSRGFAVSKLRGQVLLEF